MTAHEPVIPREIREHVEKTRAAEHYGLALPLTDQLVMALQGIDHHAHRIAEALEASPPRPARRFRLLRRR